MRHGSWTPGKIVTGGQTGVDRAALRAARECGVPVGGWVPAGRVAEDGTVSATEFPELRETPSADPAERTVWNTRDSDATLIVTSSAAATKSPGTDLTEKTARDLGKPVLVLDRTSRAPEELLATLEGWLLRHRPSTLHIAGPRASENRDAAGFAAHLLFRLYGNVPPPAADRLLRTTAFLVLGWAIGDAAWRAISDSSFDLGTPILWIVVATLMFQGSHAAMRFAVFLLGFVLVFTWPVLLYHIALGIPLVAEHSDDWFPVNRWLFWLEQVLPAVLMTALLALVVQVMRQRRVVFVTRAVRGWAIAFACVALVSFAVRIIFDREPSFQPTPAQAADLDKVRAFVRKHGANPSEQALETFCERLQTGNHIGSISARGPGSDLKNGFYAGYSQTLELSSFDGKWSMTEKGYGTHDQIQMTIKSRVSSLRWRGREIEEFVCCDSGEWLKLKAIVGGFVSEKAAAKSR